MRGPINPIQDAVLTPGDAPVMGPEKPVQDTEVSPVTQTIEDFIDPSLLDHIRHRSNGMGVTIQDFVNAAIRNDQTQMFQAMNTPAPKVDAA